MGVIYRITKNEEDFNDYTLISMELYNVLSSFISVPVVDHTGRWVLARLKNSGKNVILIDDGARLKYHDFERLNKRMSDYVDDTNIEMWNYIRNNADNVMYSGKTRKVLKTLKVLEGNDNLIDDIARRIFSKYAKREIKISTNVSEIYGMIHNNNGSIGASCMKHESCQDYFEIYEDHCQKIAYVELDGELIGRALLWDNAVTEDGKPFPFMDRVYTNETKLEDTFFDWAKENGYARKYQQSYTNKREFVMSDGTIDCVVVKVPINDSYDKYPYVDTLSFFNEDFLCNIPRGDSKNGDEEVMLVDTSGGHYSPECPHCGDTVYDHNVKKIDGRFICGRCDKEFITGDEVIISGDKIYSRSEVVWCNSCSSYHPIEGLQNVSIEGSNYKICSKCDDHTTSGMIFGKCIVSGEYTTNRRSIDGEIVFITQRYENDFIYCSSCDTLHLELCDKQIAESLMAIFKMKTVRNLGLEKITEIINKLEEQNVC